MNNATTKTCIDCDLPSDGLRCETCFEDQPISEMGWTIREARWAFSLVANPNHWKDTIDATIAIRQSIEGRGPKRNIVSLVRDAIVYFTGNDGTVISRVSPRSIRVENDGYRRGPAGDR